MPLPRLGRVPGARYPFFFGRDALVEWLLEALRKTRFLAITGPSGSGKSSLARAGLNPAIRQGRIAERSGGESGWPVVVLKPGADPIEALASALAADPSIGPGVDVGDLARRLVSEPERLHLTVRVALHGRPESDRVLILVDQFEEVFTLCTDERRRKALVDGRWSMVCYTPRGSPWGRPWLY